MHIYIYIYICMSVSMVQTYVKLIENNIPRKTDTVPKSTYLLRIIVGPLRGTKRARIERGLANANVFVNILMSTFGSVHLHVYL